MNIIGNIRPFANTPYLYFLSNVTKRVAVKLWKIEYNGKILSTNSTGTFKFHQNLEGKTVKIIAVTIQNEKEIEYSTPLKILAGKPKIIAMQWQDVRGKAIGNRTVKYLDIVKLAIKTINIPIGDSLKVSVFEDDTTGDRPMGTYNTIAVNEKGFAYLVFQQISLYQKKLNDKDWIDESEHEYYVKIEYRNHISQTEEKIQLTVQNELSKSLDKPQITNMPVIVAKVEIPVKTPTNPVNFTFGIFIDGTLNNMYNTELYYKLKNKHQTNTTGLKANINAAGIYDDHGKPKLKDSSYENDLSNPAILFKNYDENPSSKIFKIYTEGIGTNSAPKAQGTELSEKDYKGDDLAEGPGFGMGSAGITDRVRKSIQDTVTMIKNQNLKIGKDSVGKIKFDVFGFSRGAAAARHFVHVITCGAYKPNVYYNKESATVKDQFGYSLGTEYATKSMPAFGYLGQLLEEANLLSPSTTIEIRFVGIYDTVPHHGLFQSNDNRDLGLDNVNKANYVVHIIAGDEHRANFDLVDISSVAKTSPGSGKKGGIELSFPGVHCDVGGSYVEGDGDNPPRIDVGRSESGFDPLKSELIRQGWFKEKELSAHFYATGILLAGIAGKFYRLEGKRAQLSNQYSFIPLHIMAQFCTLKNAPINKVAVQKAYNFKENSTINGIVGNVEFLKGIKTKLWDYSFNGGPQIKFYEAQKYTEPPIVYDSKSPMASVYIAERNQRQIEGQARMNAEADKKNESIKFLRNHYLHWNSSYGDPKKGAGTFLSGKDKPNIVKGKRKRDVH